MINTDNTIILVIDIQEKLVNMLKKDYISEKASKLLKAGRILGVPAIITEQYPKGLGATLAQLKQEAAENTIFFEKTAFSAVQEHGFLEILGNFKMENIVLCGIEAHVCVYQTAVDLISRGYKVEIIKDITASRNKDEFKIGIERMKQAGVRVTSLETLAFELLKSSKYPNFKEIQELIK